MFVFFFWSLHPGFLMFVFTTEYVFRFYGWVALGFTTEYVLGFYGILIAVATFFYLRLDIRDHVLIFASGFLNVRFYDLVHFQVLRVGGARF